MNQKCLPMTLMLTWNNQFEAATSQIMKLEGQLEVARQVHLHVRSCATLTEITDAVVSGGQLQSKCVLVDCDMVSSFS